MVDLSKLVEAKSDQINAEDLIGTQKTIKIRDVVVKDNKEQPLEIYYEGEDNKCWRPSKGCRRIIGYLWGYESEDYIGCLVRLYRDEDTVYAGQQVGGIRINGLSDIPLDEEMHPNGIPIKIKEARHKTKIYYIERLERPEEDKKNTLARQLYKELKQAETPDHLDYVMTQWKEFYNSLQESHPQIYAKIYDLKLYKDKAVMEPADDEKEEESDE